MKWDVYFFLNVVYIIKKGMCIPANGMCISKTWCVFVCVCQELTCECQEMLLCICIKMTHEFQCVYVKNDM